VNIELGLAHLTALNVEPPDLVVAAARAGFSSIGLRVHPATPGESRHPMGAGGAMVAETVRRCRDLGVHVRDVEVLALDGTRGPQEWLPALESGAELGAEVLNVIGADPEPERLRESLSMLAQDAAAFGIRPSVEPISYQHVSTVASAHELAEATGAGVMLDVLHFVRAGQSVDALRNLPAGLVTVVQLCDGPATVPTITAPARMPLGQSTDGMPRQLESRAKRLAPGEGVFPLVELLRVLDGVPISVEVPDVAYVDSQGVDAHLARLHRAATAVLATTMTGHSR
jgi:sugar phosphate isomerase/epimerase